MIQTITFTPEEAQALDAAAHAAGQPLSDFLHTLVVANLQLTGGTLAAGRDEAAIRRRMVERWDAIDAEEDRAVVDEAGAPEKVAA